NREYGPGRAVRIAIEVRLHGRVPIQTGGEEGEEGRRGSGTGGRDHRPGDERRQVMSETTPDTPAAPRVPEAVGVYGGGRMGAGIAHAFATAGARVIVIESTDDTVVAARGRIDASIEKSQSKGIDVPGTVEVVRDPTLLDQALLVVEAVPEDLGLKQEILAGIAKY